jgi:phosphoglycerate dehydrogenase-like enzyme
VRRAVLNLRDARPVWAVPDHAVHAIARALDGWEVVDVRAPADGRGDGGGASAEALATMPGAEIYIGFGLPRELLRAAGPTLRWVHTGTAGVGGLLHPELAHGGIALTNSAGVHAAPMAESLIAMMLHFSRGLDHAVRAQHAGRWEPAPFEARDSGITELDGAALGIVGFGGIGRELAWRAQALGMAVLATRRRAVPAPAGVELLTGDGALDTLLERADCVALCVPGTPATRHLLDADRIARMRPGAVLLNVSRGSVVDEAALAAALAGGRLRGAGLDVFETEPLPADSPLRALANVLITPHVSATSPRFWRRQLDLILDNIQRYLADEPLRNRVDPGLGY